MDSIIRQLPLIALMLVLAGLGQFLMVLKKKGYGAGHRFESLKALMSPAELKFFRALEGALGGNYRVFSKVRLADIVQPAKTGNKSAWYSAFGVIKSKHVDFVVCDPDTLEFRLVVELDDKSHERNDRVERDQKVDDILAQANIPMLHFPARAAYSVEEIQGRIFGGQENRTAG